MCTAAELLLHVVLCLQQVIFTGCTHTLQGGQICIELVCA